jgi:hypothetical protein
MSVVAALGGYTTAPGQPVAAENQHKNVRTHDHLTAVAGKFELKISHGKDPQIGPLAWRQSGIDSRLINRPRYGFRSPRLIPATASPMRQAGSGAQPDVQAQWGTACAA